MIQLVTGLLKLFGGKKLKSFLLKAIIKGISKKFNLDNIKSYVEEDNELDIITKAHGKALDKYGRTLEEIETNLAIVKAVSHPPVFKKDSYKELLKFKKT